MISKKFKKFFIFLFSGLLIFILGSFIFIQFKTYSPDAKALEMMQDSGVVKLQENKEWISFTNVHTSPTSEGFIFYPGGLVEPEAYSNLCHRLAENLGACFILKMPLNLALLNPGKAQKVIDHHPEIQEWTLLAHSLGGPAAARFIKKHPQAVESLVFLASYSDVKLSDLNIKVLSLLGSQDGLVKPEVYEASKSNLPANTIFQVIEGGNHSQMGDYGLQKGDNQARISSKEQKNQVLESIIKFNLNLTQ